MKKLTLAALFAALVSNAQEGTKLQLSWEDVNPPNEIARYIVIGRNPPATNWINLGSSTTTYFVLWNIKPGMWQFAVHAMNQQGWLSPMSEPTEATNIVALPKPPNKPKMSITFFPSEVIGIGVTNWFVWDPKDGYLKPAKQ